jgi:hypothetical protein
VKIIIIDDTLNVPAQLSRYADSIETLPSWHKHCQSETLTLSSESHQEILFDIKPIPEQMTVKKEKKISYIQQQKILPKFLK